MGYDILISSVLALLLKRRVKEDIEKNYKNLLNISVVFTILFLSPLLILSLPLIIGVILANKNRELYFAQYLYLLFLAFIFDLKYIGVALSILYIWLL